MEPSVQKCTSLLYTICPIFPFPSWLLLMSCKFSTEWKRDKEHLINEHLSKHVSENQAPFEEHVKMYHIQLGDRSINNAFAIEILSIDQNCVDLKIGESIKIRYINSCMSAMWSS